MLLLAWESLGKLAVVAISSAISEHFWALLNVGVDVELELRAACLFVAWTTMMQSGLLDELPRVTGLVLGCWAMQQQTCEGAVQTI